MGQRDIIFETFSAYEVFKLVIVRLVFVAIIVYAGINFNENPVFVSVTVLVLLVLFFSSGSDRIIVYNDKFIYESGSMLKIFAKQNVYYFKELKNVTCEGFYTVTLDIILDGSKPGNKIYVEFLNGEQKVIRTSLYKGQLKEAVNLINELLHRR